MSELYNKLLEYSKSDIYPFHMPGHKRRVEGVNPFSYDITEIDGFDNLHNPTGILKEAMDEATKFYGTRRSYYLINGTTCGLLAAITALTRHGDKILTAANCHKSVYNAIYINELEGVYINPDYIENYGINGGISPSRVEQAMEQNPDIKVVIITSPTYEGIVSDVESIAEIVHKRGGFLIVDEAHGAHFSLHKDFPVSAVKLGADIVVQSLHKTLPALTQCAILHVVVKDVDIKAIERCLGVFETSSPSYVLMSSIDECIGMLKEQDMFEAQIEGIRKFKEYSKGLNKIKIMGEDIVGKNNVFDYDISKIIIHSGSLGLNGYEIYRKLLENYDIQPEMAALNYVIAMTSPLDSEDGYALLFKSLVDMELTGEKREEGDGENTTCGPLNISGSDMNDNPGIRVGGNNILTLYEAIGEKGEYVSLSNAQGCISKDYAYVYPPGIPIIIPGQLITGAVIDKILMYSGEGFLINGLGEENGSLMIEVVEREEGNKKIREAMERGFKDTEQRAYNKIFFVMGKSSSGKDTIFNMLVKDRDLNLKTIVGYTTRPMRDGETDGKEYKFTDIKGLEELERLKKVVEKRVYNTVHGEWTYFTVDDGSIDLTRNNYAMIGTPKSFIDVKKYFGADRVVPIYIRVEDGERIMRAVRREQSGSNPDYKEMCRRFLGDEEDFAEENLKEAGIVKAYDNNNLDTCYREIKINIMKEI